MREIIRYEAGLQEPQQHKETLNLIQAGFDESRSVLLARFVEFWCQKHCKGPWQIRETDRLLEVSFGLDRDAVLFRVSEEYLHFK